MVAEGRIVSQVTAYGDESAPFRVWVAEAVGVTEHHYVQSVRAGVEMLAGELHNLGMAAGLEERDGPEWVEWYDDRGCDIDEILAEAEGGPITLLGDALNIFD
jgi:hypothetical protein